ncbi:MAG: nucleoside 2-deoxyribosyltransferase [Bacillaceae bacterium]
MKFYVASSFRNKKAVRYVCEELKKRGYIHTYDWTKNERANTIQQLKEIGQLEKEAVMQSDFIVVLLPAGKGSHIELGIAASLNKKIYLYSESEEIYHFDTTSTFYHLPEVEICVGSLKDLINRIR